MFIKIVREGAEGHHRIKVFAGPDQDHLALTGTLQMLGEEANAFIVIAREAVVPAYLTRRINVVVDDRYQCATCKERESAHSPGKSIVGGVALPDGPDAMTRPTPYGVQTAQVAVPSATEPVQGEAVHCDSFERMGMPGCPFCDANGVLSAKVGADGIVFTPICSSCKGSGKLTRPTGVDESWNPCPECNGYAQIARFNASVDGGFYMEECPACVGKGWVPSPERPPNTLPNPRKCPFDSDDEAK